MDVIDIVNSVTSLMTGEPCYCKLISFDTQHNSEIKRSKFCEYLLLCVVKEGNEVMVRRLLEHKVNADVKNKKGENALLCAIYGGHVQIAKLLLDYGVEVNIAVKSSCGKIDTPLTVAIDKEFLEIVQLLLEFGADINNYKAKLSSYTDSLSWAASKNHAEIFKLLFEQGTDAQIKEAASTAASRGNFKAVTLLLNNGFDVNTPCGLNGETMLHEAAEYGKMTIIQLLLAKGADINRKDDSGLTPLLCTADKGNMKIVELLINDGANIQDVSDNGYSCLTAAIDNVDESLLKFSLDLGVDIETINALFPNAVSTGSFNNVKLLLDQGADINREDTNGNCVLELIGDNDYYKIGKPLIAHIIQMQSNNLYVSEKILATMRTNRALNGLRIQCEKEIKKLRSEANPYSELKIYDFLATNSIKRFMAFARNESMMEIVKSDNFKTNFPFYSTTILDRFENGIIRNDLFHGFCWFFNSLSIVRPEGRLAKLPVSCLDQIFDHLSDMDVKKLLKVAKSS